MKLRNILIIAVVVLLLGGASVWAYETLIYTEQGGAKMVIASGGEVEFQAGSVFDMQSMLAIAVPTAQGTATPGLYINNLSVADSVVVADGGSVVGIIQDDGFLNWEAGANMTIPTAQATGVPGLNIANSSKAASVNVAEGESVFQEIDATFLVISAPTAQPTASPALQITNPSAAASIYVVSGESVFQEVEIASTLDVQGGNITLQNDEVIDNSADATIAFTDGTNTLFSIVDAGTTGNGDFSGTLTVDGTSTLTGAAALNGGITVDSTAFTVADTSGNVATAGTLDVQGGAITLENDETIANAVDNAVTLNFAVGSTTFYGQPTVGEPGDGIDLTQTLLAMDGSDVYAGVDMNLTNADQGGTSHIRGFDAHMDAVDGQATESAYYGAGFWDHGLYLDDATLAGGDIILQNSEKIGNVVDNAVSIDFAVGSTTFYGQNAATTGGDIVDLTQTMVPMDSADEFVGIDMNLTSADHTGTPIVRGIDLNQNAVDTEATETALYVGGYWDYAMDFSAATTDGIKTASGQENIGIPTWIKTTVDHTIGAGGTTAVATVASSEIWVVHDVLVHVTETAATTAGTDATLAVGTGEQTDGFCTETETELNDNQQNGTGFAEGWVCNTMAERGIFFDEGTGAGVGGFILESTETIDAIWAAGAGDDITAGTADIYVMYTRLL